MTETAGTDAVPSWHDAEISLANLGTVIIRGRRTILRAALGLAGLVLVVSMVLPRTWTARATFMPQGDQLQLSSSLASLAGQFGVSLGSPSASAPGPQFYVELAKSREVLGSIAARPYSVADTLGIFFNRTLSGSLAELLRLETRKPHLQNFAAMEWLKQKGVSASASLDVGVVRLSATTKWPDLSLAIINGVLEEVSRFNLETRQSDAAAERKFVGERMSSAEDELRSAERELQQFLRSNRTFQASPELLFEHDRLQRIVQMRQGVYTALAQSFEQARITEVRNTPVISLVERPAVDPEPDNIYLLFRLIVALVVGAAGGLGWLVVQVHIRQALNSGTSDITEFLNAWREARNRSLNRTDAP
ncbi:MAG: hypothetical protein KF689_05310 [Gemmatimonadaceae bacterium]|nr:hypothetical protein [Gemmatimonadaceae bacterium]MCW5825408.1 hypothetical protein [Gemmatimonadaceae bacterium]